MERPPSRTIHLLFSSFLRPGLNRRVWWRTDLPTRCRTVSILRGHTDTVSQIEFVPNRKLVVTRSLMDETTRVWDYEGHQVACLKSHEEATTTLSVSADGRYLFTGGHDGFGRIWNLRIDDLIRLAEERATRDFTPYELPRFAELLPRRKR